MTPNIEPDELAHRDFPTVRRGLDPSAVRRALGETAAELRSLRATEARLRSLLEDAERRAAAPLLDEAALTAAVGSETARVLQTAHEAAREVVQKAEQCASEMTEKAETSANDRLRSVNLEAGQIRARALADAEDTLEAAKSECRTMIAEARAARRRIIEDLFGRRRALHGQIEQLRAAKDSLAGLVGSVADAVDAVRQRLIGAESEAQEAAEEAVRLIELSEDLAEVEEFAEYGGQRSQEDVVEAGEPEEIAEELRDAKGPMDGGEERGVSAEPDVGETVNSEPVVAEPTTAAIATPESASEDNRSVDELFAKIRASRAEHVAHARSVVEETKHAEEGRDDVDDAGLEEEELPSDEHVEVTTDPASDTEEKDPLISRRSALLNPIVDEVSRAVKRCLRSEQNELLDALRQLKRGEDAHALVPAPDSSARLQSEAALHLSRAWASGFLFATDDRSDAVVSSEAERAGSELALELASEIVSSVERRFSAGLAEEAGDPAALADLVGVTYREWKGARVESVASDVATKAFSLGTAIGALRAGLLVRWGLSEGSSPCPDCDDNALTPAQDPGKAFPTGHGEPPAHAGCRCILVPVAS